MSEHKRPFESMLLHHLRSESCSHRGPGGSGSVENKRLSWSALIAAPSLLAPGGLRSRRRKVLSTSHRPRPRCSQQAWALCITCAMSVRSSRALHHPIKSTCAETSTLRSAQIGGSQDGTLRTPDTGAGADRCGKMRVSRTGFRPGIGCRSQICILGRRSFPGR